MKILRYLSLILVLILTVTGVCGCMNKNKLYGSKVRNESDKEYAQMMLEHIENKYGKNFEIVDYVFPEEGFNTDHLQNVLLVKDSETGVATHVYATLGSPYTYYDAYVSDLASSESFKLVDCSNVEDLGSTKLYLYLRNEDIDKIDISKENISRVVLLVNITQKPDEVTLKKLYDVYQDLFALDYEYIFLVASFTEQNECFDNYVNYYRVFGKKDWADYDGKVYTTLSAQDAGLTFEAFKNLCEYK